MDKTSIEELRHIAPSIRIYRIIRELGVEYLEDLCNYSEHDLLGEKGFGKKSLLDLKKILSHHFPHIVLKYSESLPKLSTDKTSSEPTPKLNRAVSDRNLGIILDRIKGSTYEEIAKKYELTRMGAKDIVFRSSRKVFNFYLCLTEGKNSTVDWELNLILKDNLPRIPSKQ